jgi:3-hydroxypropanoate dehydrogenase
LKNAMNLTANDATIDRLFESGRSHNGWLPGAVADGTLRELHRLCSLGPTAFNAQPMRLLFITTEAARQRLLPALRPANVAKSMGAPVLVVVAYDSLFHMLIPRLYHNPSAGDAFAGNPTLATTTALRNGSLQGGYLIMAARALGLDCAPMSGFDNAALDAEFFPDGRWRSNFLCGLGHGDPQKLFDRLPRLPFEDACQVL